MTIGDLIEVRSFPAVVQAGDVQMLRAGSAPDEAAVRDFVGGYLGFDERSRHALSTALHALAQTERGGAFFFNGVFGSGKSHLLGLLALLADGIGHTAFAETHPQLATLLHSFTPRLVVHFSLDNYDAARFSLEDIFWREVRLEWARRGLEAQSLVLPEVGSRAEYFAALDEASHGHGFQGLVVCLDELSLFLSARPEDARHHALQADAAFLQFLGQRAVRSRLWVFAALQKTMEDIGALEAYSLSQIRDRFTTLPLSLAHIPSLVEHRLIVRKDAEELHRVCQESYEAMSRALPRLDFGRAEWEQLYPFYPATTGLLEQVVARFFSRTRSAALFCAGAAHEAIAAQQDAALRVLPDALFDYLAPELEGHPDLRPLVGVWTAWRESLTELAADEHDALALERLMKGLLLFKIAGSAPTVLQLANTVALDAKLPGDGNYEYTRVLLERLRTRGSYLAVEHHEGDFADRYTIDLGTRVGEMARRFTQNTMTSLPAQDARIAHYALRCCRDEPLPLATLESARSFTAMWRNAPRQIEVEVWNSTLTVQAVANRVAMLSQPGHEADALLLVVPPFVRTSGAVSPQEVARAVPDARWRSALLLWTPRPPARDEVELAREATAQHLLEDDPQLLDNRRGRAILGHLEEGAAARETALARLAVRLLREGQITTANLAVDAADLALGEAWTATLEALCEFALPHLFPRFESVAPRLRVLTAANCDQLCLEILRRPVQEPFFAASLERAVRAIAEPLGVARLAQGRWQISALRDDLADAIKALLTAGPVPLAALEAHLAKSEWGLRPEQSEVAVCTLLRCGEVAALDARGGVLVPTQIGMPLRRAVHALRPGRLLADEAWSRVQNLVLILCEETLSGISFAEQERARSLLARWQEEAIAETELAQARLHQLRRALGHTAAQWLQTETALAKMATLLEALSGQGSAVEMLERAAAVDAEVLRPALSTWRTLVARLEERLSVLLSAHALLMHPELSAPPDLQESRAELLARLDAGEDVLHDDELLRQAEEWRTAYAAQYREWHAAQHDAARWATYRRLASDTTLRALERLATLSARKFEHGLLLRQALSDELEKGCSRDGSLPSGGAVCNACRLRWGERVRLRDPRELEEMATQGLAVLRSALQEPPVRERLAQSTGRVLLEWNDSDGNGETLLPILSDGVLQALDEALRPRRRVGRSWPQLQQQLSACRTRAEFEAAFAAWLDGGENLSHDDEIALE